MSSSYPNTMYSNSHMNENIINGVMPIQSHLQQQQPQQQQQQQQQQQYPQYHIQPQGLRMDKFLPPNQQNFHSDTSKSPLITKNTSGSTNNTNVTTTNSAVTMNPFPPPLPATNSQLINQQHQNVPSMIQHQNNAIINGDSSTHSSRTASPALNKPVFNQFNNNSNRNISNESPKNYFPPLSSSTTASNIAFSNSNNQQQSIVSSIATTSSTSPLLSTNVVGINKPNNHNFSNLNDSMKNLSIEQNTTASPISNAANNVNGYQKSSISTNNSYSSLDHQRSNFKTSALNSQQQQKSQNLVDNHQHNQNPLLSNDESATQSSTSFLSSGVQSMNANQYVPTLNKFHDGQKTTNAMTAANIENRNILQNSAPFPSSSVAALPRNDNSYYSSPQMVVPQPTTMPQHISNSHLTDNKPNALPPPPLPTPVRQPSVASPYQGARKSMYPPASVTQLQQQQQQQPYSPHQQQRNLQSQPPLPQQQQLVGQPNAAPLKYQSSTAIPTSSPYSYAPSVTKQGFNKLWGQDVIDLMQHRHILPHEKVQPPKIVLNNQFYESVNCNPDIMRCTLNKIPESNNLLQKSRLPLGILVHPFRDINSLPVIQCPNIVRCRLCRAYINPFVYLVDSKMWKCNLCYRVNELPEDFQYDPATKTYGDVTRRPEVRSSTIEFIAPSEYMLRPPQPAIYLFLFDVSIIAQQSGYLDIACSTLLKYLDDIPGDARTRIGFIAFNSEIHFYNIAEGYSQPHEMTLVEIDDPFLPRPDNLLINLKENRELIKDLLNQLPTRFEHTHDPGSAFGAALQVAYKLMSATGGRVTVFQTCLPNKGSGALQPREDPNNRSSKDVMHLNPATDFYKRHALDCSGYQIAVDLFVLNQQYCDLATISGVSKYSGGSIYHFPLYQKTKPQHVDALKQCLKRYLTRKIGFEAVMRIRCTRGLQVHTFHGNFFVRSTDLLSLPNVNPDAGYGMQISYEENLIDIKTICFQSALLYTNSEGERRIRVHTLCLPVTSNLHEVMHTADPQAIVSLLSKMAVDRCMSSSVTDARDAFINATIDIINAFKVAQNLPQGQNGQLLISKNLSLLPLYISALLKHIAFRIGTSTRLDDRIAAMDSMKTLPLDQLMKTIYPEYYLIDPLFSNLDDDSLANDNVIENQNYPPILQLSAEFIDSRSMFLIDSGTLIIIYVGLNVPTNILENVLGVQNVSEIPDYCYGLQSLNTPENTALRKFVDILNEDKPYLPTIQIIRETSTCRNVFIEKLVDDRSESSLSYYEFLQHLRSQIK